jgi:hypothetical protein
MKEALSLQVDGGAILAEERPCFGEARCTLRGQRTSVEAA